MQVKIETGILLKEFTDEGEAGLNYAPYDLSLAGAAQENYLRFRNENRSKNEKPEIYAQTDTGKQYLRPGKFIIELTHNGKTVKQDFYVQGPEKNNR